MYNNAYNNNAHYIDENNNGKTNTNSKTVIKILVIMVTIIK